MTDTPDKPKSKRGFASMDPDKLREVSARGGSKVAPEDRPFARDPELAAQAGRMGKPGKRGKKS